MYPRPKGRGITGHMNWSWELVLAFHVFYCRILVDIPNAPEFAANPPKGGRADASFSGSGLADRAHRNGHL